MINSVFQTISNKFQPGSPDCILSTENAVNLRISLVFIKACLENIIPCLLHGTKEGFDDQGATFQYKGSLDTTGGFRRGIIYYGSFLHPQALQIGLFTPTGKLEKGYMYRKEKTYTSHATNSGELVTINMKFSNGNFVKGIYPISGGNTAIKWPSRGGEIHHQTLQGTFHTDNTFSGTVFSGKMIQKGVFSFQETPDGVRLNQLSGTQEMSFSDGTVAIMKRPKKNENDQEEGEIKHADGSVQKGIFRTIEVEDGIVFKQISGTFVTKTKNGTRVGTFLYETIAEGKETMDNGSFREGIFYTASKLKTCKFFENQYSGNFKLIREDGVFEGRVLTDNLWEGSITYPDGSCKRGFFEITDISSDQFTYTYFPLQLPETSVEKNSFRDE